LRNLRPPERALFKAGLGDGRFLLTQAQIYGKSASFSAGLAQLPGKALTQPIQFRGLRLPAIRVFFRLPF
jgi:hypothetical protein